MTNKNSENTINKWAECMSALPDKDFFSTMRIYLGEIKTPYNKQRLIEQLASFIRNPTNTKNIISLLDDFDVLLLTAISLIPGVTEQTLQNFFENEYTYIEISTRISNLKERLLIFEEKIAYSYEEKYKIFINPLLSDELKPFLNINLLLPQHKVSHFSTDDSFTLSPNILSAFISYIKVRGIACKNDGQIKKNDMTRLEQIFQNKTHFIQSLMNAFINLNLVCEIENKYQINTSRLESFAQFPEMQQYALLCSASITHMGKDFLRRQSQLFLDCLSSIPKNGYTRSSILHLSFLVDSLKDDLNEVKKSRFSKMIETVQNSTSETPEQNSQFLDMMIDCAIEFGLLQKIGTTENDEDLFTCISTIQDSSYPDNHTTTNGVSSATDVANTTTDVIHTTTDVVTPKVVNLDSTYTVTIMPGLSLKQLLPLTSFMVIKKTGVVTEFEITKQSVSSSFDSAWLPEQIFSEISKYSYYDIPQNLKINITEWYNSYSSAMIYHGYVLKVANSNIALTEKNPNIQKYLKEKLAEGIYLLNLPVDCDIKTFMEDSGLDFLGKIKNSTTHSEFSSFPSLQNGTKIASLSQNQDISSNQNTDSTARTPSITESKKIIENLKSKVNLRTDLSELQKESLLYHISKKLILCEEHLLNVDIKSELLEANGMDFHGKCHLIESAIKERELIQMQVINSEKPDEETEFICQPIIIEKSENDAVVRMRLIPSENIRHFEVSKISYARRIRH